VTLRGNDNTINVTSPSSGGNDIVQLGAGVGDTVNLDHAGGSVTGTGLGTTTVTQAGGARPVTVNLHNGVGDITLANGNDTVTANGAGSMITAGNGNDTVTANGGGDTITLGNGRDTVTANGGGDSLTLGNGNSTVTANGGGDTLTFGNGNNTVAANGGADAFTFGNGNNKLTANGNDDTGTFGAPGLGGNNTLTADGSGDTWTFNEKSTSTVTATIGGTDTLSQTGGVADATLLYAGDTVNLSGVKTAGSTITSNGNDETFDYTNDSGGALTLNPSSVGDSLTFAGDASNKFTGAVTISGLSTTDSVTLSDLYTTGGAHITSFTQMLMHMSFTPTGDVLALQGGGDIKFAANTPLASASFHFV